jgi:uncharacterized membrane protein
VDVTVAPVDAGTAPTPTQRWAIWVAVVVGVVLRVVDLGGPLGNFDESFTGSYSHLPIGQIPSALRSNDAHPPLDYLLRHFFGSMGDTAALRVPSALFACLTLLVVVWWMWRRGWFGVAVVALTAIAPFQLLYAHQARMYALAALLGTVAVVAAEQWLRTSAPRWRWVVGAALLVGLFDHAQFLLAAGALLLVAWTRRDREAWAWRATICGCVALWAVVWGPSFLRQAKDQNSTWIPFTSVSSILSTVNGLVDMYAVLELAAAALLAVGAWLLWRRGDELGRLWLALFAAPLAAACLLGLRSHFLLPRTLAFAAWAVPLAFAALVDRARRVSPPALLLVCCALFVVVVPSIRPAISYEEGSAPALRYVADHLPAGDAVTIYPRWLWPLAVWDLGAPRQPSSEPSLRSIQGYPFVLGGAAFDGRVWVLQPTAYGYRPPHLPTCGHVVPGNGDYEITCYQVSGSGVTPPG